MPAILDLRPQSALEFELAAIAAFEGMIRQLHADQYRRIQRARELAAEVDGVTRSNTAGERNMATRAFVAELATTLGQHEASARVAPAYAPGARADASGAPRRPSRSGRRRAAGLRRPRARRHGVAEHTTAWECGGHTADANLGALCRHHHRVKHESGWRVVQEPGGVMRWTSPAGHVLRTMPERPFVPVGIGEGLDPPGVRGSADPSSPPAPPDCRDPLDDELRCLLVPKADQAPF
jgi:hypothetical protein